MTAVGYLHRYTTAVGYLEINIIRSVTKYSTAVGYLHRYTTVVGYLKINIISCDKILDCSRVFTQIHDCGRVFGNKHNKLCDKILDCSWVFAQIHDCSWVFTNKNNKLSVTKYSTEVEYLHRYTAMVDYLEINMTSSL